MEEMNVGGSDYGVSERRSSSNELATLPPCERDGERYETEEPCDSNNGPKSTVSFGGKMKSPFLGKTLPCGDDSDDDDEEEEDEVGYETNASSDHPAPFGSEQLNGQCSEAVGSCNRTSFANDLKNNHVSTYEAENETEEELKAYEMRRYESKSEGSRSSSEDDDTSDEDSKSPCKGDGEKMAKGRLLTFVSGKQARSALGKEVHRPKPMLRSSPTQSLGESGNVSKNHEHDNDGDGSSCASDSSSSGSVGNDSGKNIPVDDGASSSSNNSSDDQASIYESDGSCNSNAAYDESGESTELSSDSDENAGGEDETSVNEQGKRISSPWHISREMELDETISGNKVLSVDNCETMESSNKAGTVSPRNSLSFEDVEDIIKDNNSSGEDIGPESKLCFSEDEQDITGGKRLHSEAKEHISNILSDALDIKRSNAGVLAALRSLCVQGARPNSKCCQSGHTHLPDSTCESFWIDEVLATIAPDSKAAKELVVCSLDRTVLSEQIYDMFHSKLSSVDISCVDVPPRGVPSENMDPAASKVNHGEEQAIFIGSLGAADCGLALAAFGISHVIRIECAAPDNLDVIDGVKHSIHILPCDFWETASASETVKNAANDICSALQNNDFNSVLVSCETGNKYACAACALFLMRHLGMGKTDALEKIARARPSATVELDWLDLPPSKDGMSIAPFSKRILSSQMLSGLTGSNTTFTESPKRPRLKEHVSNAVKKGGTKNAVPPMPSLDLGPSLPSLRRHSIEQVDEPVLDESFECERYLSEELNASCTQQQGNSSTPVPLLTPPSSPLVVKSDKGETTVCEWPSNLAVDTALAATMSLSPPSPSLCQEKGKWDVAPPPADYLSTPRNQPARSLVTGLTPKLNSIQVSHQ